MSMDININNEESISIKEIERKIIELNTEVAKLKILKGEREAKNAEQEREFVRMWYIARVAVEDGYISEPILKEVECYQSGRKSETYCIKKSIGDYTLPYHGMLNWSLFFNYDDALENLTDSYCKVEKEFNEIALKMHEITHGE